jgi:hypothetical protein
MGISDRDYMREPIRENEPGKPQARIKKADNRPGLLKRLKFWIWSRANRSR